MPVKIRKLKAILTSAGFVQRPAKGSHTMWVHPAFPNSSITISGKDGDDAQKYQIKDVQNALKQVGETL